MNPPPDQTTRLIEAVIGLTVTLNTVLLVLLHQLNKREHADVVHRVERARSEAGNGHRESPRRG